jgi:hypothetical protein
MPRFNVSISFSLRTEIEPEGMYFDRNAPEGAEDVEDNSYWRRTEVDADGGNVTFVAVCEDEDAARALSEEFVYDGQEWTDDAGFAWLVDDVDVEIEEIVPPMTLDRAKEILTNLIASGDDEEIREAVEFVFDAFASMEARLSEANERIAGLVARVEAAEARENA